MKKYVIALLILMFPTIALAAEIDHFDVEFTRQQAKVAEGLDITITAMDSNNQVVLDYTGDILVFSESDIAAEFPNELAKSYKFKESDQGTVKFENAIKYTKAGTQDIFVYDLMDETKYGSAEIEIGDGATQSEDEITIISPENNITIGENQLSISGKTTKNHQVRITVNAETDFATTSDDEGLFEKTVEGLSEGENIFQAFLLGADQEVISESKKISVKINSSEPEFKSIKFSPENTAIVETPLDAEVIATSGLSKVSLVINDTLTALDESGSGVYTGKVYMPASEGTYDVDVKLQDDFGHSADFPKVDVLEVTPELPSATGGGEEEEEEKPVEVIEAEDVPAELDLTIKGIKVTELKDRSIITWDKAADAVSYNIYKKVGEEKVELITNVTKPRYEVPITGEEIKYDYFTIRAVGETEEGEEVNGNFSEMTKVQTGPEMIIFALLAMLLGGGLLFHKSRK